MNCDSISGALRVEILNENGDTIQPFSADKCNVVRGDSTKKQITWFEATDLSSIQGTRVRFRFHATNTKLYSFWVSNTSKGESGGYLSAGGPGIERIIDCA